MISLNYMSSLAKVCGLATCFMGLNSGLSMLPAQAQAQINQATVTEILDGTDVFIQGDQAQVGDRATFGQQVSTGNARTQIQFNNNAVGRLATHSVLTIGQCVDLHQGSVLVNGAINGCTTSIVAGVRGTTYLLQVDETGHESVTVLEGEVFLERQPTATSTFGEDPQNGTTELPQDSVTLTAGQTVELSESGPFGMIETLGVEDFRRLLQGVLFNGFTEDLPGSQAIRQSFETLYPGIEFPRQPSLPDTAPRIPNRPRF
ncbi:MAG: FecR domain-containing protein [Leptolyngbyaceae cyanobacterium]